MAGEVTRRQQKLQIAAEAPPPFLGPSQDLRRDKRKVEPDMRKVYSSNPDEQEVGDPFQDATFWTKARKKAKMNQKIRA